MKLTRCMHMHYYDGSKFAKCPQCVELGYITSDEEQSNKKIKNSFSIPDKDDLNNVSIHPSLDNVDKHGDNDNKTIDLINDKNNIPFVNLNIHQNEANNNSDNITPSSYEKNSQTAELNSESTVDNFLPEIAVLSQKEESSSLQNEISSVRQNVDQDAKTISIYNTEDTEPTVGWLVALNGAYMGESFNLKTGRNTIGRWTKMDVALPQEASVSRDRHAILTYEPLNRKFFIQPGEGNALVYLNSEILLIPTTLKDGDIIELGKCKLFFKALCSETFSWDTFF